VSAPTCGPGRATLGAVLLPGRANMTKVWAAARRSRVGQDGAPQLHAYTA